MAAWLNRCNPFRYGWGHAENDDDDRDDFVEDDERDEELAARIPTMLDVLEKIMAGRPGAKGPSLGRPPKLKLPKLPKLPKAAQSLVPSDPLTPPDIALVSFRDAYGAETTTRVDRVVHTLGIASTHDAAGLANGIPPGDRAAYLDWFKLLVQYNSRLHDLPTASAIAVMITRLTHLLKP